MSKLTEKFNAIVSNQNLFVKVMLVTIALGVWGIFIQNFTRTFKTQEVAVVNIVSTRPLEPVSVNVENEVEVDLQKVLGYPVGCRRSYNVDGKEYQAIDVWNRAPNW